MTVKATRGRDGAHFQKLDFGCTASYSEEALRVQPPISESLHAVLDHHGNVLLAQLLVLGQRHTKQGTLLRLLWTCRQQQTSIIYTVLAIIFVHVYTCTLLSRGAHWHTEAGTCIFCLYINYLSPAKSRRTCCRSECNSLIFFSMAGSIPSKLATPCFNMETWRLTN